MFSDSRKKKLDCKKVIVICESWLRNLQWCKMHVGIYRPWQTRTHCCLPTQIFPRLPAHATFVADTNFVSGTQKMFLILFKNILPHFTRAPLHEDTSLRTHCCPLKFLGLRKLGNICCGHKIILNKIRNNFCVPDTMLRVRANGETFVSATITASHARFTLEDRAHGASRLPNTSENDCFAV